MLKTAVGTVVLLIAAIAAPDQSSSLDTSLDTRLDIKLDIKLDFGHDHHLGAPPDRAVTAASGGGVQLALDPHPDPADLNGDGHVDFVDLVIVLAAWNTSGHGCDGVAESPPHGGAIAAGICNGDVNGDHVVDFNDLVIVLTHWTG